LLHLHQYFLVVLADYGVCVGDVEEPSGGEDLPLVLVNVLPVLVLAIAAVLVELPPLLDVLE